MPWRRSQAQLRNQPPSQVIVTSWRKLCLLETTWTRQGHIAQGFPGLVEGLLMRQIVHACVRQKANQLTPVQGTKNIQEQSCLDGVTTALWLRLDKLIEFRGHDHCLFQSL